MTGRMSKPPRAFLLAPLVLALAVPARAELADVAKCQKGFAREGAKFALRVLRSNLRCTDGISECQIECELGQFGASCETSPPPCCDPDDTGSNAEFADCMDSAQADCDQIIVRANTREDDVPTGVSSLHPTLTLLDASNTPVADTNVRTTSCAVPNVCATGCPVLKRALPYDGNFRVAVGAYSGDSCAGGNYKLTVITPGGAALTKVADDVTPTP